MRVVAGSEHSVTSPEAHFEGHLEALSRLADRRDRNRGLDCTLIVRAANSGPAHALTSMKTALAGAGVRARAIVARLEPQDDLKHLCDTLAILSPEANPAALIRWARNPRLLDAHEQATYGAGLCWTGDAMRRDPNKRNPLAVFETNAPEATRLASQAFAALWAASVPVPGRHFAADGARKPSGAYGPLDKPPAPAVTKGTQGWPLLRH